MSFIEEKSTFSLKIGNFVYEILDFKGKKGKNRVIQRGYPWMTLNLPLFTTEMTLKSPSTPPVTTQIQLKSTSTCIVTTKIK